MRDDRDELAPCALELSQALAGPPLQGEERRLVDRERGLVRERPDEGDLRLGEGDLTGDAERDRAEESVAGVTLP